MDTPASAARQTNSKVGGQSSQASESQPGKELPRSEGDDAENQRGQAESGLPSGRFGEGVCDYRRVPASKSKYRVSSQFCAPVCDPLRTGSSVRKLILGKGFSSFSAGL